MERVAGFEAGVMIGHVVQELLIDLGFPFKMPIASERERRSDAHSERLEMITQLFLLQVFTTYFSGIGTILRKFEIFQCVFIHHHRVLSRVCTTYEFGHSINITSQADNEG
jgi:hypothetical protein